MPEYRLKKGQERFSPVEGPFAGCKYEPGIVYPEVPPNEVGRFEDVSVSAPAPKKKGADA